jgi:predicted glycosyltransferase involved in capsule biosynthesis
MYVVYNYFNNYNMLEFQIQNWNKITDPVTIVLVDDCSKIAAAPAMKHLHVNYILYRMSKPAFHGAAEARNVGVMATLSKEISEWFFISDMDIVLTAENYRKVISKKLDDNRYYKFKRLNSKGSVIKTHMNTYIMKSGPFWRINGYDADYVGTYGGDSEFLDRLRGAGVKEDMFEDICVTMYDENDISDANCSYDKKFYGQKYKQLYAEKAKNGKLASINPIRREYEVISMGRFNDSNNKTGDT